MSTFWLLVMSHTACVLGGAMIARNPEKVKAALAAFGLWLTARLSKPVEPPKVP